jgi:hypothetical protein
LNFRRAHPVFVPLVAGAACGAVSMSCPTVRRLARLLTSNELA